MIEESNRRSKVNKFKDKLLELKACSEPVEWVGERTLPEAWRDCERADWMLWYLWKINYDRKQIVLAACACARTVLKYVPPSELRPLRAIESAEAWTKDEASLEQVTTAVYAAHAAGYASYAGSAVYAASAGSDAVSVAFMVSAASGARIQSLKEMADIVRSIIPEVGNKGVK